MSLPNKLLLKLLADNLAAQMRVGLMMILNRAQFSCLRALQSCQIGQTLGSAIEAVTNFFKGIEAELYAWFERRATASNNLP